MLKSFVESVVSHWGLLFSLHFICGGEVHVVLKKIMTYFECETTCEFAIKIITNKENIHIH